MHPDRAWSTLDEVDIQLFFGAGPEDPPQVVYAITVEAPAPVPLAGQAWVEDRYLQALEPLTHAETGQPRHPYSLQVRHRQVSPGGQVAGVSIHLYLAGPAATGAISAATLTAARTAFETIGAWSTGPRPTLDGTRALQMAMRRICTAYTTVSPDDLDLLRQQELPGGTGWALDIAAPGPTLFQIEISTATGVTVTTRISNPRHDPTQLLDPAPDTDTGRDPRLAVSMTGESN